MPQKSGSSISGVRLLCCAALLVGGTWARAQCKSAGGLVGGDGIELQSGASVLDVQVLEDGVVGVHIRPQGRETPRTLVMSPRPVLRAPSWVHEKEASGVCRLSTPEISVSVLERPPYSITFAADDGQILLTSDEPFTEARAGGATMIHTSSDVLYGINGLGREDRGGGLEREQGGKVAAGVQGDSGAPFVFSKRYGWLLDSDGGEFTNRDGLLRFANDSRPDVEYFVIGGPPLKTMAAMSRLVGPPPLPPKWTLGFLNSQWGSTEAQVEKIVATYRTKRIPLDGFILDFDWKAWGEDNYGEWRWNSTAGAGNVSPDKFPNGASGRFAKRLAAEGVQLAGILKPRILTSVAGNPNQPTEAAAYATEHHLWYPDEVLVPDYYSHRMARNLDFNLAETRTWYWNHLLPAFRAGMEAWWNDEADESGGKAFNNFQFLNMGRMLYDGQRSDSNLRVWSLNRNFYLGASRYGYAGWSGDIKTGFASMAYQRQRMLAALDTGEFHWSMDTGGFSGKPNPENYARWIEFSALVPIMRVHGNHNQRRQPWVYGPVAEAAARNAIDLRYTLLPYIYSYERLNSEGEVGLIRPLFWQFPSDAQAATVDTEWMFGDALLAAPVVTEGATSESVYLPAGLWFDYASGQRFDGEQSVRIPVDAVTWKDIPLFVRAGSIVATQPLEQFAGQHPISEITLDIFPSTSKASFLVYDDDGKTYAYEEHNYLRQMITAFRGSAGTTVQVFASTGNYTGALRRYLVRLHTTGAHVEFNGRALRRVSRSALARHATMGWTKTKDRFGPVILARIPAGTKVNTVLSVN